MTALEDNWAPPSEARVPPNDEFAEQCVLGAMLLSTDAVSDVVEMLRGDDFYRPAHALVFDVIVSLYGKGQPADAVVVAAELMRTGELQRTGGAAYLHTLTACVPTAANASYYAGIVRERSLFRGLASAGTRIAQMGYLGQGDVDEAVDRAQAEVFRVSEDRNGDDYVPVADLLEATLTEIEAVSRHGTDLTGVPTGFTDLDSLTHGLHPGQLVLVAGRPAMGKSVMGLSLAANASLRHGVTSVVFSLEMSRSEIVTRLLSAEGKVALQHLRSGSLTDADWTRLAAVTSPIADAPLFIDDSPGLTLMEIRSKCRRLKQSQNLGLLVVDYLQLLTSGRRFENRQQEVSDLSRSLKLLAKELEVPVVALSQLNRGPELRAEKRPMLSDLRESGGLENDADVVILLHREDVYDPKSARAGEADFIVAKHRNGPTAVVSTVFQGHYSRFVDMASSA